MNHGGKTIFTKSFFLFLGRVILYPGGTQYMRDAKGQKQRENPLCFKDGTYNLSAQLDMDFKSKNTKRRK